MRIAMIGAGGMGSLFGGWLAGAGVHEVWLVDPWTEHVISIRQHGLELVNMDGSIDRIDVNATTDSAEVTDYGSADLAFVFVKGYATERAARQVARILADDGLVVTLQDGLGNREVLADIVGAEHVVQGVTEHVGVVLEAGRVRHAAAGTTHLTDSDAVSRNRVDMVASALNTAGIDTSVDADLDSRIWGKLIVSAGINPLSALLRVHNGVLTEGDAGRRMVELVVGEAVAVAHALGITLPYDAPTEHVLTVARETGANRSSMLTDILRGNPTEINTINGAIVREGERLNVPTPVNSVLVALVNALENTYSERIETDKI